MPCGLLSPDANVVRCEPSGANTVIFFASDSARKTSPLGATARKRGCVRPDAKSETVKPCGACGMASAARGTTDELLSTAGEACGAGRLDGKISKCWPGASAA